MCARAITVSSPEREHANRRLYHHSRRFFVDKQSPPCYNTVRAATLVCRMLKFARNIPNGAPPFLLTFTTKTGSHGVVGYGLESGASFLYYDSTTLDYCIPYYGVHVADGTADNTAGIIAVSNDLRALDATPASLDAGDYARLLQLLAGIA